MCYAITVFNLNLCRIQLLKIDPSPFLYMITLQNVFNHFKISKRRLIGVDVRMKWRLSNYCGKLSWRNHWRSRHEEISVVIKIRQWRNWLINVFDLEEMKFESTHSNYQVELLQDVALTCTCWITKPCHTCVTTHRHLYRRRWENKNHKTESITIPKYHQNICITSSVDKILKHVDH